MKKVTSNKLILFCLLLLAVNFGVKAQDRHVVSGNYIFNPDSLKGFDENAAKQGAFAASAYGDEFKVYMYAAKRQFINGKYNIIPVQVTEVFKPTTYPSNSTAKGNPLYPGVLTANCINEDFEEGSLTSPVPGTITVSSTGMVNGWLCQGGSNSGLGASGNCTATIAFGTPNPMRLIAPGAAGLTDGIIGSGYQIYSVFGNTATTYPGAAAQDPFNHYGDWFIKLNDQTNGSSVNRISKTISTVTSANALFQFAFITVLEGSHSCCDGGGFSLKVKIGCAVPVTTTCPQFTAAVQPGCISPGNTTTYITSTVNPSWKYNKWKLNTLDLTSFIGNCVTIEVTAYDCTYTGHAGYVYFDAQCSPMDVVGNGNSFPAGTPSITLPTCGAGSTATITAPPVTGGYTWTAPGGPGSFTTVPGGQTIITTNSGQYTLTMNPPGSCSPIIRLINVIISPAPNLAITTNTQPSCAQPTNGISIQMSSGTPNTTLSPSYYSVSISPTAPTGTIGAGTNTATYTGLAAGVNTITIADSVGCIATQTININAIPPIPSFTIDAPNTILGCNPAFITATAVATSTNPSIVFGSMTFTWTSSLSTTVGTIVNINQVGTYTVFGQATYTTGSGNALTCTTSSVLTVTGSTAVPTCSITGASTKTITCNGACASFTALTSGTANIIGTWDGPSGQVVPPTGTPMILCANAPGTYTANFCSTISGCCASQTVAVVSSTTIPTISVTVSSPNGYTINCTNPKVIMNTNSSGTCAPIGYTWTPLANPTASVMPVAGGFTATIPGQYEVQFHDCNMCYVTTTVNVYIDTLRPSPASVTNLPSNSYTINCYNPTLVATGVTNPLLPPTSYSWTQPGPLTISSNTTLISMGSIPGPSGSTVTYTVAAMGPNGCVGKQKVVFAKDTYTPSYLPVSTPSTGITCYNPCVAMSPSSSSTVPITFTFTSPAPTQTATTAGALMCVPGPYTMTYINQLNGCPGVSTVQVNSNLVQPALVTSPLVYLPCGQTTTIISANTLTTSPTYSYSWEPATSGSLTALMSCLGGTACSSPSVNMAGLYSVLILNTANGCSATNTILVVAGGLTAGFTPSPADGFSPLSVTFNNSSVVGSTTSGSLTTFWNYGNGTTYTTTGNSTGASTVLTSPSTIYQSAGNYTVTLVVAQYAGTVQCLSTATAVIHVELPSQMEIPNVFTPNDDGVNDVFMLQTTNLTEITCQIFDRWGVKMYDVTAEKGNIEWDGKNLSKKDVPAGTYFYLLKAKGKDLKDYEQKGTISLYR